MGRPVALITGASRGIGKAIALKLSVTHDLALTCQKNLAQLQAVATEATSNGSHCVAIQADAGNQKAIQQLFEEHIVPTFGQIDLIVNNAGISHIGLLTDMNFDEWRQIMATNLDSLFLTSKYAVPLMVSQKSGTIINISSIWGNNGASCEVAYSASKGGVNSFTKALAKELAPSGIRVNAVACGAIDTEMNQWLSTEDRLALTEDIGLGRIGTVNEVADMVAFLASPQSSYVTGQVITIDGGI